MEHTSLNHDKSNLGSDMMDKTYASVPKCFSSNKIPLKKIYILQRDKESKIINLKSQEAFMELVKNTFGIHMFSKSELPDNFFKSQMLLKNIDVAILKISNSLKEIRMVVKIVEEDIGEGI
jgi:hypothetical protein